MSNKKVGIYTRVSSQKQIEEGHSLSWQEHNLNDYANNHDLNIIDVYVEEGISGDSIDKRPQLKRLLNDIKNGKIDNILVYKVDRLGRNELVNSIICKVLIDNDCIVTSSDCGVMDLSSAFGAFMYNILSAISQYEVDTLAERVINGKKQRTREGLYINSNSVYGYDAYCDYKGTRLLKINEFESQIIKEIYNSYISGISMNNIASELNDRKIPCKRGGRWCQSTIRQILSNKLYIGIVTYNGNAKKEHIENKGKHESIIDVDIFNKVQEILKSKHKTMIKKFPNEYSYFSSILYSNNNASFKPKQTKAQDKTSVRYYCKDKNVKISSIRHIDLEKIFAKKLEKININYSDKIIKDLFKNPDYDIITDLLDKIKREQMELFDLRNSCVLTDDVFKRRMQVLNTKTEDLNEKLEEIKKHIKVYNGDTKKQVLEILNRNLMINFMKLKPIDKKNFVNLFVDRIVIDKEHNISIEWKRQ